MKTVSATVAVTSRYFFFCTFICVASR